jgi:hypothetical protein
MREEGVARGEGAEVNTNQTREEVMGQARGSPQNVI